MGVNTVQLFCVILQEIHPQCSLEFSLFFLKAGVAANPNPPLKNIPEVRKRHQNSAPLEIS